MKQARILLLEDEQQLARIVTETLRSRNFFVTHAANGVLGTEAIQKTDFDICIVDIMMPFMDGLSFVRQLRQINRTTPVLFLTAKSQTEDVIKGYESGGNDYLKKPFSLEELILRVNELLRRRNPDPVQDGVAVGAYTFFITRQELWLNDTLQGKLSHRETELLKLLIHNKNQVLDRKAVLLKLWGDDSFFNTRTMDVFITKLRKRLQQDPSVEIINIRGVGYKLITGS
ncbi:MAG TPA: response regulator transcription factor [Mucilaginibacter sp.]|nr:response regulator transcription factor [Mucilaginibacter sp.]